MSLVEATSCADHVIYNSFPMICISPLDICYSFLDTEHDQFDWTAALTDTTLFWFRFKQSTECHAVVTEFRIVSNNLVAVAEIQNCRTQSGSYIIWHFPS